MLFHSAKSISDNFRTLKNFETFSKKIFENFLNRAQNMNSKPPKPNSQVSIYMNLQNEMAEKYSNLPYTLKKLQDFTFSEIKFLVGGGSGPPPPLQALGNLLYY